ncbi:MAG: hypothetical protein RL248_830 [Pseudomonadota bacterium]|jgi:hypothetical protein
MLCSLNQGGIPAIFRNAGVLVAIVQPNHLSVQIEPQQGMG